MSEKESGLARKKKSPQEQIKSLVKELVFVAGTVLLINSFVMASFEVPTGSMEDTVKIGDFLFVSKFLYGGTTPYTIPLTSIRIPHIRVPGFRKIQRGDVIVFDWPGERDQIEKPEQVWYLKRCIGLPGDTVRIQQRLLFVNGKPFPNPPHLKFMRNESAAPGMSSSSIFPRGASYNEDNYGPITVPKKGMSLRLSPENFFAWDVFIQREGHSAVMIDGRISIDGKATDEYRVERDYLFAMGDSRDNSLDSRFWGFVPVENVVGTPLMVYWSWNPNIPLYKVTDKIRSIDLSRIGAIIR